MAKRDHLIGPAAAAKIIGVSRERVHQWIRDGRLAATRIERFLFLNSAAVKRFAERRNGGRP